MVSKYKHIGFLYTKEDLGNVGHKRAEDVIRYINEHPDSLVKDDAPSEETDYVPEEEYDECAVFSDDGKYIVIDKTLSISSFDWKSVLKDDTLIVDIYEKYDECEKLTFNRILEYLSVQPQVIFTYPIKREGYSFIELSNVSDVDELITKFLNYAKEHHIDTRFLGWGKRFAGSVPVIWIEEN